MKTLFKIAAHLHILQDIQDVLDYSMVCGIGRTDEDQIGMSYFDLEKCMKQDEKFIVTVKKDLKN